MGMKDKEEIVKQTVLAQETTSFDPNDPEVNEAATTIQAGYRGMKTRHTRQNEKGESVAIDTVEKIEIDIDLNDPEVEMAATKIQSGYKGMKTRQEIKARKKENEETVEQNVTAQ